MKRKAVWKKWDNGNSRISKKRKEKIKEGKNGNKR